MKKNNKVLLLFLLPVFLFSCSKTVIPPKWDYELKAVNLYLKTDPKLHLYSGIPHTLVLCIYFLTDPNEFNQQIDDKGGLEKLCECSKFHPSVTNAKRFILHPDKEYTESLDRPAGAQYVGIVAGYYKLQKENVVRLYKIPVIEDKSMRTITQKPGVLNLNLFLGPQQIEELRGKEK
ncbi:MAG: type VI secretion system-associated lipoprotein [Deltaproteobacteria bacterium RBG_16_49_23]|nr:MAG: type VI secretion system-associated lipoprotein [Deltaproteobacteria bacterium RBG_16_49_23]